MQRNPGQSLVSLGLDQESKGKADERSEKPVDNGWCIPDERREQSELLLPPQRSSPRGSRLAMPDRQAMDVIFYALRTGGQGKARPRSLEVPSTVHDRFQDWREAGVFARMWHTGLLQYDEAVGIDGEWPAMDGAMTKASLRGKRDRSLPHRPPEARDEEWLPIVGQRGWVVLTKDKRIRYRPLERLALLPAGVRAFVLTAGNLQGAEMARIFIKALPAIRRFIQIHAPPFIATVTTPVSPYSPGDMPPVKSPQGPGSL